MNLKEKIKKIFQSRLKLLPGTRLTSLLFIGASILIAGAILFAANIYYNLDTGEIVMEEIQRVANVIRATAGLIVGGTVSQNPASGYVFEVVGKSRLATTTITGTGQLEFQGSDTFAGFKAPASYGTSSSIVYILPQHGINPPQENYVLTWTSGNQLKWQAVSGVGAGDITAVGDCANGECFTGTPAGTGTTLWFKSGTNTGALTIDSLTANATYTLPAVSAGVYYFTLSTSTLTANRIPIVSGNYTFSDNPNLTWDSTNLGLVVGSNGNRGQLRIYSNNANYLVFTPASALSSTVTYTWPTAPSVSGYILTSDTSGNLSWTAPSSLGLGDITAVGDCASGDCFTGAQENYTLTFKRGTVYGYLTLASGGANATYTLPAVSTGTYYFTLATTTFPAGYVAFWSSDGNVITGSNTLVISGDSVLFKNQYPLAQTGKQVLREMVPIFGFDLPVKTSTTTAAKISRDIVSYPLNPCESGSTRVHKLVVRYGSTGTSTIAIATSTAGDYSSATLAPTGATSTGSVATVQLSIPTPAGSCTGWNQGTDTTDWWVTIRLNQASTEIMIYQIFLAGYDEIQ
jgi:hypothetical protein